MAKAAVTELFGHSAEEVFKVIMDFESYPKFLPEVKNCKVLKKNKDSVDVEMTVNFVKTAKYSIRVFSEKNKRVWWNLIEGDFFKKNDGEWLFEDLGTQSQVTYSLDVDFKIFVPSMISKKAVAVSLPTMIKNFKKRLGDL